MDKKKGRERWTWRKMDMKKGASHRGGAMGHLVSNLHAAGAVWGEIWPLE